MAMMHYLNGEWVEKEDLKISAFDISVLRGFGVFDFLRTYRQKPFRLGAHIDRLFNSAKLLGVVVPRSKREIEEIVLAGIGRNQGRSGELGEFNIRIVVTGGVSKDSISIGKPSLIIIFTEAHDYPEEYYTRGIKITTFVVERIIPEAKSINYFRGVVELQKAKERGAVELLHVDRKGRIYEGMTSNFFAVIDGKLITPKERILSGITREVVLEIAQKIGIPCEEKEINMREAPNFAEAFVTASNKEVMPVVKVDEKTVGNGRVGEITERLMREYRKLTRGG